MKDTFDFKDEKGGGGCKEKRAVGVKREKRPSHYYRKEY